MARATVNVVRDTITPRLTPRLYGPHARKLMVDWLTQDVQPLARKNAPRDKGDLADSLHVYIGSGDIPRSGGFKTDSRKFFFVHGRYSYPAPPRRRSRPYWPRESQTLKAWALRKGIPIFLLRRAISQRGTPIVPFVAEAVEQSVPQLTARIRQAESAISREFKR